MKNFLGLLRQDLYFLKYPRIKMYFLIGLLLAFIWFCFDASFALMLGIFLRKLGGSNISPASDSAFFVFFERMQLSDLILVFVGLGILRAAMLFCKNYASMMLYQEFLLLNRLRILKTSLKQTQSIKSYETVSLFSEDVYLAGSFYQQLLNFSLNSILLLFVVITCIRQFDTVFMQTLLCFVALMIPMRFLLKNVSKGIGSRITAQSNKITKHLLENLRSTYLINLYRLNDDVAEKSEKMLTDYRSNYSVYAIVQNLSAGVPYLLGTTSTCIVLYLNLDRRFEFDYMAFFYLMTRLAQIAGEMFGAVSILSVSNRSVQKLVSWYKSFEEVPATESRSSKTMETGKFEPADLVIDVQGLGYSIDDRTLFSNISFRLKEGDILAIEGASGAGKSTLVDVMLGLRSATRGKVLINGTPVVALKDEISEIVAYVGPENLFFEDTLRNNLLWGNPKADKITDEEIFCVLSQCAVLDEVKEKGNGLDFVVTEAVQFSTGQKQRLALARALLRKPKLLVLDEATANVDSQNENKILASIQLQRHRMISAVISHKGNASQLATQVVRLGNA